MTNTAVCGRPNPGADDPSGYVKANLRMYPHFCRCSRTHGHTEERHRCSICKAEWPRPAMDPEHPSVQSKPWPPVIAPESHQDSPLGASGGEVHQ